MAAVPTFELKSGLSPTGQSWASRVGKRSVRTWQRKTACRTTTKGRFRWNQPPAPGTKLPFTSATPNSRFRIKQPFAGLQPASQRTRCLADCGTTDRRRGAIYRQSKERLPRWSRSTMPRAELS